MIKLDEDALIAKGVSALGARRKMLKVFEMVRKEMDAKVCAEGHKPFSFGIEVPRYSHFGFRALNISAGNVEDFGFAYSL